MPFSPPLHIPPGWKPSSKRLDPHHARDHGVAWRAVRQFVLIRDGFLCQLRLQGCGGSANTVDHIIEATAGGSDHPMNLRAVCPACHNRRHSEKGGWQRA
jgi:5-methylcytosine-specific restriction protein A